MPATKKAAAPKTPARKRTPAKKATAARKTAAKKAAKKIPAKLLDPLTGQRLPFEVPVGARYDHRKAMRAVVFIEGQLRHTKGRFAGAPFLLEPWQRDQIIRPLFGVVHARGEQAGLRWYSEALILLPRKNGKSEIAAAIALYMMLADGEFAPEVYSVAGGRDQAGLVFKVASDMVTTNPRLKAATKVFRRVIECPDNAGLYRVLSSDAGLQHGLNPSCAIIDEYHVHKDDKQYEAMSTGTGARLQPLVVTITTVGDELEDESKPLPVLYKRALERSDPHLYFLHIGAPEGADAHDPAVWRAANPASWITDAFLAKQYKKLPIKSFEQLHLNRWPSQGAGGWLPQGAWEQGDLPPFIDAERPVIVTVDAASRRDRTGVILGQLDDEGVHHVWAWAFDADPALGYFDFSILKEHLRMLAREFIVSRIVADTYLLDAVLQELDSEGLPMEAFPQNHQRMAPASQVLFNAIVEGRIRQGGDQDLADAIKACTSADTPYGWRMTKIKGQKNDLAVALLMYVRIAEQVAGMPDPAPPTAMVV